MKAFAVLLADLEKGPKHVVWPIARPWLDKALEGSEAQARGQGAADVTLSKDGPQVIVQGKIHAPLVMPCARTLDPVDIDVDAELLLLLSPAPAPARPVSAKRSAKRKANAAGGNKLVAAGSRADAGRMAKERALSHEDAAQDHYFGDEIVLDAFIREFILLELPMVPLRSDLREVDNPAIPGPPEQPSGSSGNRIDPRLAPLAEIAGRLKEDTKE